MPFGKRSLLFCSSLLPSTRKTVSASTIILGFEAPSHGPRARCLRLVVTVARLLLTTTQDSLLVGGIPFPDETGNSGLE